MEIIKMTCEHYDKAYRIWSNTDGMGLRTLDDSYEGVQRFLMRNPQTCFIAKKDDSIVGVILSGHDGRRGYIYHAVVIDSMRGKGIGKKLLERAETALRSEGINKVALVVFADNQIGNEFWEAQGYIKREDLNYRNKSINEKNI